MLGATGVAAADKDQLDSIGKQQLLTRPFVYHKTNLFAGGNATLAAVYPHLAQVLAGAWDTAPGTRLQALNVGSSLQTFMSLAKNKEVRTLLPRDAGVATVTGSAFIVPK